MEELTCLSSLKSRPRSWKCWLKWKQTRSDSESIKGIASSCQPLIASLLADLNYESAPTLRPGAAEACLTLMQEKVTEYGWPLDTPVSSLGFRLGFSEGALAYPEHPVEVQAWIGIFTWLVVQLDDMNVEMRDDLEHFQARFTRGEKQPHPLMQGLADHLNTAQDHWDPVPANIIVTSTLDFLTSNVLETHPEFRNMKRTKEGIQFPYYYRNMSGITQAFAVFTFPKTMFPDMGCYLETIPDMALFINIFNDVTSFYKEELAGETHNYIHNRAQCEQKSARTVVDEVRQETVDSNNRIRAILKGREPYARAWELHLRGHIAMHTVNPRYRLSELGLGEPHPLPVEVMDAYMASFKVA